MKTKHQMRKSIATLALQRDGLFEKVNQNLQLITELVELDYADSLSHSKMDIRETLIANREYLTVEFKWHPPMPNFEYFTFYLSIFTDNPNVFYLVTHLEDECIIMRDIEDVKHAWIIIQLIKMDLLTPGDWPYYQHAWNNPELVP